VKVYIGSACGYVGQVGHCDVIYWEYVLFGRQGRAL